MGSKNNDGDGQLLLYKSADLQNWSYVGTVWKDDRTTMGIYECPDLAVIDGTGRADHQPRRALLRAAGGTKTCIPPFT